MGSGSLHINEYTDKVDNKNQGMNKRILFNLAATQPIGNSKFHGGGKYGLVVFKRLVDIAQSRISVYYDDRTFLDEEARQIIEDKGIVCHYSKDTNIYDAARKESSIIYSPLFAGNDIPEDIKMIHTQHGMRILEMPNDKYEFFYGDKFDTYKNYIVQNFKRRLKAIVKGKDQDILKKRLLQKNLYTVTVSEHSKASIQSFIPEFDSKTLRVFYSPSTIKEDGSHNEYINPYGKYYLIISANRWIKNGYRMLKAMDELFCEHPELEGKVVVTGLYSWRQINIKIANPDRFVLVGYVEEKTLVNLYRNAYLLVYGSLNEGFGYPPLEAMHEGCPIIASAIASIPEVCGDAVLYCNPYLISEIKMRIIQMEDYTTRQKYIEKGKIQQQTVERRQKKDLDALCNYILSFIV